MLSFALVEYSPRYQHYTCEYSLCQRRDIPKLFNSHLTSVSALSLAVLSVRVVTSSQIDFEGEFELSSSAICTICTMHIFYKWTMWIMCRSFTKWTIWRICNFFNQLNNVKNMYILYKYGLLLLSLNSPAPHKPLPLRSFLRVTG